MRLFRNVIIALGLLAGSSALAEGSCEQGRQEVAEALQHARLDDYTKRQVEGELSRIEQAQAAKSETDCEDAIGKLKHILHLDH